MTASNQGVTYRELLTCGRFYYGAEVVTSRGLEPVDSPGNLACFARDLLADPRIGWISITDNPGGGPMLPPDWLAGLKDTSSWANTFLDRDHNAPNHV